MLKSIRLELTPASYNVVIQGLQELPWRISNPIIVEIDAQVQKALAEDKANEEAAKKESMKK